MQRTGRGPFLVAHMVVSRSVGHSWIKASREAAATQVEEEGAPRPGSSYPASATRPQIPLQGWTTPSAHHVNRVGFEREHEIVANHIFRGVKIS